MNTNTPQADGRELEWREALRKSMKAKERTDIPRVPMNELEADYRSHSQDEVIRGLLKSKRERIMRCLDCAISPE
jgi:glutamate synthase (NADPH/NADH) small chain